MRRLLAPLLAALLVTGLLPGLVIAAVPTVDITASVTVLEDGSTTFTLTSTDDDGDATTAFTVPATSNGGASIASTTSITCDDGVQNVCSQTFSFDPAADVNGPDAFDVTSTAGGEESGTFTVNVTVTDVNDPPAFTLGANVTVDEDSGAQTLAAWASAISPGPSDEAGQNVSFSLVPVDAALFSVAPALSASTGTLTFTPAPNAFGTTVVNVTATDNGGQANGGDNSTADSFTITLTGTADAPVCQPVSDTVAEDSTNNAIAPDCTDPDGDTITGYTIETPAGQGTASADETGLTYTPGAGYVGADSFGYSATANGDQSATATASITVSNVNDPPVAGDDTATVVEDTASAIAVLVGDTDTEGNTLTVTGATGATKGTLTVTGGGTTVTYTPTANATGADSFTYTISDGNGGTDTGSVAVTITAVNDAPGFTKGADVTSPEDGGVRSVSGWATGLSAGPGETQALTFLVTNSNNALFSAQPAVSATGTLTYTAAKNQNGAATVSVLVQDDGGTANGGVNQSAIQTFTITVTAVNDAPSFTKGVNQAVAEDAGAQTVTAWATLISDGPNEPQVVDFLVTNSNNALFSVQPAISRTGTLTYTPAANRNGSATVSVALKDNGGTANGGVDTSATQTFTITVSAVNDAPIAANDVVTVTGILPATLNVRANDSGGPNEPTDVYLIKSVTQGAKGRVTIVPGGTGLVYDPIGCATGTDTFTYTMRDNAGLTDAATVLVTIAPVSTSPQTDTPVSSFVLGSTVNTTIPVVTTWCATDPGVGIVQQQLQASLNAGGFTAQTLSSATATSVTQALSSGFTYAYRARAKDSLGRIGGWATGPTSLVSRFQENNAAVTYTGTWSTASSTTASGGAVRFTSTAGARAAMTFTGRNVAIVAPKSATRGSFRVRIDGVLVATVSLSSTTSLSRQVVFVRSVAAGTHTIEIEAVGNGRVDLDAIMVLS